MAEPIEFKTTMQFAYGVPLAMAPGVVRVVANNPGPFTFKGTNTYLVGGSSVAVIDPGPDDPAHIEAVLAAAGRRPISHILLTHTHHDHLDGLPALQARTGARTCGYGRIAPSPGRRRTSPSGGEYVEASFSPDIVMRDGDRVSGPGWELMAVFTPGHAPDHLCFALAGSGVLFSGDHVMAWNTSVVAPPEGNMADYMRSLDRLIERRQDTLYLPGHGGRLESPLRMARAFRTHRQWREQAILEAIRAGHATIGQVAAVVYRGIDARLERAAALSVQAHVEHLIARGLVRTSGPLTPDQPLSAV
jgi:glyoxylase-like metal-dependent hydrolase (beta-lactamase superfamily II)